MQALKRVAIIAGMSAFRTYRSWSDVAWILIIPVLMSVIIASWVVGGETTFSGVRMEMPNGRDDIAAFQQLRGIFGIYLIFVLSALIARAGSIHKERLEGQLQRTIGLGVPYHQIVAAHFASVGLIGLIQAVVFLSVTGALGVSWLMAGWWPLVLSVVGMLIASSGLAVGVAGLCRSEGQIALVSGGGPSLLAMLGGAFFPLDVAPANVQRLAVVNPIYWSMQAMDGAYAYQGFGSMATPMAVLLLFGAFGAVIGIQGLRRLET